MAATPQQRLEQARGAPDFVTYGTGIPTGSHYQCRFSIHSRTTTGEFFIEVTQGNLTKVGCFRSRHKGPTPPDIRTNMTLVDAADAYEFARRIAHSWHHRSVPPFP
jgi:hypothetical protein